MKILLIVRYMSSVVLMLLASTAVAGCAEHDSSGSAVHNSVDASGGDHEQKVGRIIAGLWTNSSTVINESILESKDCVDVRIGNALVALLADGEDHKQPQDEPVASILDALKSQGWKVAYDWTNHQYIISGPDSGQRARRLPVSSDTRPTMPLE